METAIVAEMNEAGVVPPLTADGDLVRLDSLPLAYPPGARPQ